MTQGNIIVKYILRLVSFLGKNLYCPSMSRYSTIGYGEIVSYAAKAASIYDAFDYFLCNGHSFKLDGVGTFSLKLNAATDVASSYDAQGGVGMVKMVGVNFLPDMELKTMRTIPRTLNQVPIVPMAMLFVR